MLPCSPQGFVFLGGPRWACIMSCSHRTVAHACCCTATLLFVVTCFLASVGGLTNCLVKFFQRRKHCRTVRVDYCIDRALLLPYLLPGMIQLYNSGSTSVLYTTTTAMRLLYRGTFVCERERVIELLYLLPGIVVSVTGYSYNR